MSEGTARPEQEPVVRDKRRIDPETGALREPADTPAPGEPAVDDLGGAAAGSAPGDEALAALQAQLAERTADLQRLQAEYANYRRRVDRDREVVKETALANVLTSLLPVLDDLDRAAAHGELVGGFKAVADALVAVVEKLGLQRFGTPGDPFDPNVHEALMHEESDEVEVATAVTVLQPGFRIGERVVRPARVAVAEPSS
ncbi:molecular chaperone GrpE [Motilibacter rhizosphaerae]|uniref:Protein GrpE n=1 Tax=Motilibacter rhizosphaerae TaxID=598652 RepID=A0A4Q7NVJ3_9ACTN|nr:nucleotide exchange factor GrpE [Motilibacter rhizosphaerae]RZS90990.1 molecular chaperone GrpE [Motilibacter rhizosphaerae]